MNHPPHFPAIPVVFDTPVIGFFFLFCLLTCLGRIAKLTMLSGGQEICILIATVTLRHDVANNQFPDRWSQPELSN